MIPRERPQVNMCGLLRAQETGYHRLQTPLILGSLRGWTAVASYFWHRCEKALASCFHSLPCTEKWAFKISSPMKHFLYSLYVQHACNDSHSSNRPRTEGTRREKWETFCQSQREGHYPRLEPRQPSALCWQAGCFCLPGSQSWGSDQRTGPN